MTILLATAAGANWAEGTELENLPVLEGPAAEPVEADYLIHRVSRKATVYRSADGRALVMDNGLIRRVWRIEPNCACVAFDNLTTDETLLRGVRPEATVVVNGRPYDVGGLVGQPNYAYLLPEWLDSLEAAPGAFRFVGLEIGEPQERLAWGQVRHHAPDVAWPPEGVYLRMDYALPRVTDQGDVYHGRPPLYTEDLTQAADDWSLQAGVSTGAANSAHVMPVFAERAIPDGTRLVEVDIDPRNLREQDIRRGVTLVWEDRTAEFSLTWDTQNPGFFVDNGLKPKTIRHPLVGNEVYSLRMRLEERSILCEARTADGHWQEFHRWEAENAVTSPKAVRIGPIEQEERGPTEPFSVPAALRQSRFVRLAVFGAADENKQVESRKLDGLGVSVHYEMYDGVPIMSKWVTVRNGSDAFVEIDRLTSEILAVVEDENLAGSQGDVSFPIPRMLHVESDFTCSGSFRFEAANRRAVHWEVDPLYPTQSQHRGMTPCLLKVKPERGPDQIVQPGQVLESLRAFELVHDGTDRERRGLAVRRFYRALAPWVTEDPLIMHLVSSNPEVARKAIDQAAECGFEMVQFSFGSGLKADDDSEATLATFRELSQYAGRRGIQLGAYSLLSSRRAGEANEIVASPGEAIIHGRCPALTSEWGQSYFARLRRFFEETGFMLFTNDGSYPGCADVTPRPPVQRGVDDSQWVQWQIITDFYQWQRARGIFLRVPDYYYLSGSNTCGMGYRESNWSLPRAQQAIHTRQNIYDGTWHKTPSMGWMFVPLLQYHGGGPAATVEPLDEHVDHYERMITANLGLGVQAVYRGLQLYDTPRVRDMVKGWVSWYKQYRDILESDLIHGRRADGRDIDWMLHVNPHLQHKGMLLIYNPLDTDVTRSLCVNLYYTGLDQVARVTDSSGHVERVELDREYETKLTISEPASGFAWYLIEDGGLARTPMQSN